MKHFNLDLVRVTEAGAVAASHWIGSGNKEAADKAASEAMRERLNRIDFAGCIAIGEGIKDRSYGLFAGEYVGKKAVEKGLADRRLYDPASDPMKLADKDLYDLAIDPIEGTTPTVTSGPEALSTIAVANSGCMYQTEHFYMNKLAYGEHIFNKIKLHIDDPIEKIVKDVASATGRSYNQIMVCILNRPRHNEIIAKLRELEVRIKLINDCDVSGAIAACLPDSGIDLLYGIGGAPEAVISACAIKCLRGDFQTMVVRNRKDETWMHEGPVLGLEDLVSGECAFVATGITNGSMLKGVRLTTRGPVTNSVIMRSESGTIRWIEANHGN